MTAKNSKQQHHHFFITLVPRTIFSFAIVRQYPHGSFSRTPRQLMRIGKQTATQNATPTKLQSRSLLVLQFSFPTSHQHRILNDRRPQVSVYLRNDDCEVVRLARLDILDVRLGKDLVAILDGHLLDIATPDVDIESGAPKLASDLHGVPRAR